MLTRVLVLLLLNVIATVLPVNAPNNDDGIDPDLTALLWLSALRTKLVSSEEERSLVALASILLNAVVKDIRQWIRDVEGRMEKSEEKPVMSRLFVVTLQESFENNGDAMGALLRAGQ